MDIYNNTIIDVYPARVKHRGFSEEIKVEGYIGLSKHIRENSEQLLKEERE